MSKHRKRDDKQDVCKLSIDISNACYVFETALQKLIQSSLSKSHMTCLMYFITWKQILHPFLSQLGLQIEQWNFS